MGRGAPVADSLPPLDANAVRDALTKSITKADGSFYTCFATQRDGLVAMRNMAMDHNTRLAALEGQLAKLPFPFRVSST